METKTFILLPQADYISLREDLQMTKEYILSQKGETEEPLLTRAQLARILQRSTKTISDWTKEGKIPAYRISRKYYYRRDEVFDALNKVEANKL